MTSFTVSRLTRVTVPPLARFTWYRHRVAVLAIPAVFGVTIALLIADDVWLRAWLDSHQLAGCLSPAGPEPKNCSHAAAWLLSYQALRLRSFPPWLIAAAGSAVAMFIGLPWVTSEFESGTFRYTWVQSVSPRRWLLGTFGSLAAIATAAAAVCGAVFDWWSGAAEWQGRLTSPWSWDHIQLSPLTVPCWMLFGMALAMVIGVLVRHTVPAIAVFILSYGAWLSVGVGWLQSHLARIAPVVRQFPWAQGPGLPYSDLTVNYGFAGPGGHQYTPETVFRRIPWNRPPAQIDQWLAQHHLTFWISYQPASRTWIFQLAWAAILLTAAAACVLAAVCLLRRRLDR